MKTMVRRDFVKSLLAGIPMLSLDWGSFPRRTVTAGPDTTWDAIIIGSGLGGLSAAAAFARQGFKALVLEQHTSPGGYATTFKRPGGFVFDVSLHSTTVGERDGLFNLIPGFPEIKDIDFVPHRTLYRVIFPEDDIRVPAKDVPGYIKLLADRFPAEKEGIAGLFEDMRGLAADVAKLSQAQGQPDMSKFPTTYPYVFKSFTRTWGGLMDARIKDPKLKAIVSSLWGYYGLPPSKLASIYYALPTIGYLEQGGYYPVGKSQKISDAFVKFIRDKGGEVKLGARVEKILSQGGAATGVKTKDGTEYSGRVVVSNADAFGTFRVLLNEPDLLKDYLARLDKFGVSLSSFQIFLGLKKDLVRETGLKDTEIFYETDYDPEAGYRVALEASVERSGFGLTLYDNLYKGYSPEGKNTVSIITLQGYEPWKKFEADYFKGNKTAYKAEKERQARILIEKAEKALLPGLSKAIEVMEIGTPLTNVRYTGNHRGAIYGWDQTLDNSAPRRLAHATPIKNLYLSGAWTSPGGGYSAVISSGLECFAEIMRSWKS
ncbi:MAG: NAD(P)/FAD-dependent oxidoreductase [Candidatus Aminicenantes bacterium]|nr:NAD(P)/FAD-dependent oxidoreductase [Candidatus Aminicenantes bacterium]